MIRRPRRPRRLRRLDPPPAAFTLIEVVLVILILLLLLALLLPALTGALGSGTTVACQSRLRQIGLAYRQYQQDHGNLWPPLITAEAPETLLARIEAETGLARAPARPAEGWGQPGPHWSIVLYPYLRDVAVYTCPADPKEGQRGTAVTGNARAHGAALLNAPPESYALNVLLFRTAPDLRRQAGCTWGLRDGEPDFNGLGSCTSLAEQRRLFPALGRRVLFLCGASGQTVGSQFNIVFRDRGLTERWEWHPRRASAPFVDEPGCGANYLFHGGHVEYRDASPSAWEWGMETGRP